ncbi:MAG TPA: hypothetical protein VFT28_06255 [Gemmatimonadales bacterium]|nr:hypothetical protein [Gemmatimonadales bacterium]
MRLRTYYTGAILVPLAVFAAIAAAGGDDGSSTLGLGPGATVHWLYPRAGIRELIAYAAVSAWLLWTLHHRTMAEFQQAVWRAPLLLVAIHLLFPLAVVLANGLVRQVAAEQGGRIVLRLLVRLLMGFCYVALTQWVRRRLPWREPSGVRT